MMKKLVLLFCFIMLAFNTVYAATTPEPTKKVVLFYRVPDTILQCQNADEDIVAGAAELEKELKNHYSKRFIVQEIRRADGEAAPPSTYQATIKPNQIPFIVKIDLAGEDTAVQQYQNAFGAKATGYAPAINIHLIEALPNANGTTFIPYDYGTKSYSAGTFAVGRSVYAAQTDPRKNVKNAVRASFRDACQLNDKINKYANPMAYDFKNARFKGEFEKCHEIYQKAYGPSIERVKKFETWCNSDPMRQGYLNGLNTLQSIDQKITYINQMITMKIYQE